MLFTASTATSLVGSLVLRRLTRRGRHDVLLQIGAAICLLIVTVWTVMMLTVMMENWDIGLNRPWAREEVPFFDVWYGMSLGQPLTRLQRGLLLTLPLVCLPLGGAVARRRHFVSIIANATLIQLAFMLVQLAVEQTRRGLSSIAIQGILFLSTYLLAFTALAVVSFGASPTAKPAERRASVDAPDNHADRA